LNGRKGIKKVEKINANCPCPNHGCGYHGKCRECARDHHGKSMYCKLPPWRKKINDILCRILPVG
jgi:hypothetical protein